jgi:hypothetical protein
MANTRESKNHEPLKLQPTSYRGSNNYNDFF